MGTKRLEETLKKNKPTRDRLKKFRRELKIKETPAEKKLRTELRKLNLRFQVQRPFHSARFQCIVDFYFRTDGSNVIIEIDGDYHYTEIQLQKDEHRTRWLENKRICHIIRFTNNAILTKFDECVAEIAKFYLQHAKNSLSRNYNIFKVILGEPPVPKMKNIAHQL